MAWYVAAVGVACTASGTWLLISPRSYARIMLRQEVLSATLYLTPTQMRGLWGYLAGTTTRLRTAGAVMVLLGLALVVVTVRNR